MIIFRPTLRMHILKLVLGVLAFSSVATLVNVWLTTTQTGQSQVFDTLNVGEGVLKQVFADRESQLINSAQVLTADFGFKQAVATRDKSTIESVLSNHGARIDADVMALLNLEGTLLSSTIDMTTEDPERRLIPVNKLSDVLSMGGATFWTEINGEIYQSILLTIDAPTPIAIALVGFKVDTPLLQRFDEITQLNTTVRLRYENDDIHTVTTLPKNYQNFWIGELVGGFAWLNMDISENTFVSREFSLTEMGNQPLSIVLSANVNTVFATFRELQSSIFVIAAMSLALAAILGLMLANNLTRPLSKLVEISDKLADGDYQNLENEKRSIQEVNQLTSSFKTMQNNIQQREKEIKFQAQHDIVTGLYNRSHVGELLADKLSQQDHFQVVGLSVRGFRQLNDTFGHQNVDLAFAALAERMNKLGGLVARISNNEFLWSPAVQNYSKQELREIQAQLEQPFDVNNLAVQLKVTLVAMSCPADAQNVESLFRRLNIAFDHADKSNQEFLFFNSEYEQKYTRRLEIIRHLKFALSNIESELSLVYQPKMSLKDAKVRKVEALIRWNSEALGFVPPDEFIEIAEQASLIYQVTQWVIKRAVLDAKTMRDSGHKVCVAINLSARDIMQADLLPWILSKLSEYSLPVGALSFELTESDLVTDAATAAQHLQEYRDAGFHLAIDDFGTGYSSLAYLQNLPVSDIKIDKSFVLNLATNDADQKIVTSIIALAKSFDMKVVAEGIEDKDSMQLLTDYGCDWAQGYFICRPVPLNQLLPWLDEHLSKQHENTV